jgi:NADPH-dependent 2,4-dienoyl-CoA reductase/sulfur reductase-like enzyme
VVVIGAGVAGLSAAREAALAGAEVAVIDSGAQPGGQYHRQPAPGREAAATALQREGAALATAATGAGAEMHAATSLWNITGDLQLDVVGPNGTGRLVARAVVVAEGAHELVAPFPGWALPGVLTAGAAQTLLKEHGTEPGRRVLLAGSGPLQLVVAAALAAAGVPVVGVVEASRPARIGLRHPAVVARGLAGHGDKLREGGRSLAALARRRVPVSLGHGIVRAHGVDRVEGATVARLDAGWRPLPGSERRIDCDTVVVHHGLVPAVDVCALAGADLAWRPELGGHVPVVDDAMATSVPGLFAAGDGTGIGGAGLARIEGEIAGRSAAALVAGRPGRPSRRDRRQLRHHRRFQQLYATLFGPRPGLLALADAGTPLCRCESVGPAGIDRAVGIGATSLDGVKAISRCGMGNCQGRVCATFVAAYTASRLGSGAADPGSFRPRPPLVPVPLAALVAEDRSL